PEVLKDLDKRGLLFAAPKFEHDYPHCWRCGTPLIYYARSSWFIKVTEVKEDLIRNNKEINWIPKSIGEGRFGDWLENIQDWGISRNRYWGTPLNIWECPGCGNQTAIGSRKELAEKTGDPAAETVELHRPYIDRFFIKCEKCGQDMKRVPEVIDCWFDSGAMPFAQLHYPFENKELFDKQFPAQFISEAVDQTRGWFYSLHAEATLLFNKPAFKNVIVLGLVQDENGQKMSKSKGNAVDPFEALATYGADAIRWYFYTNSAPWLPSRFAGKTVQEGQRGFLGTLWNTYAFFVLYANIDGFSAAKYKLEPDKLPVMDRWILSRLMSTIGGVDEDLENYRIPEAGKKLAAYVDDLSNWYVRRCRERFWAGGMEQDKINAYMTLWTCLVEISKAAAPMVPFMTEEIYRNLVTTDFPTAPKSVHLCDFPAVDASLIDKALEKDMEIIRDIVVLGRSCRNTANIKNRQPIARMFVRMNADMADADIAGNAMATAVITEELNVKEITFTDDVREFTSYSFKPQLKTVGPKYGKLVGAIGAALKTLDGNAAMDELNEKSEMVLDAGGEKVTLTKEDLLIEMTQKEGFVSMEDYGITVVLDTNLTQELIDEGIVNEVISKLQNMRKDAGFEVTDHIEMSVTGSDRVAAIVKAHEKAITDKVLAERVDYENACGEAKAWDLGEDKVTLGVKKIG
nr:class I tRNA ligase family protein [Lachnospiraceae bacterium]